MRIHIYRHGKTPGNAERRYIGSTDQSLDLAYISDLHKVDAEPELVYVTPLVRTQQTAKILFPNSRQIIVEGFREMNFGIFENKNYSELKNSAEYSDWIKSNCDAKIPSGEDKQGFCDRVVKAFKNVILPTNADDVYIVAHGGTIMALLYVLSTTGNDYYHWMSENGHGYVATWNGQNLNDIEAI